MYNKREPKNIYVVKNNIPLYFGKNEVGLKYLVTHAFTNKISCLVETPSECILRLNASNLYCYDYDTLKLIENSEISFSLNKRLVQKESYKHFMLKEIHSQSSLLSVDNIKIENLNHSFFENVKHIIIGACGSSYYAGTLWENGP